MTAIEDATTNARSSGIRTAEALRHDGAAVVDLEPGDATRYRLAIIPAAAPHYFLRDGSRATPTLPYRVEWIIARWFPDSGGIAGTLWRPDDWADGPDADILDPLCGSHAWTRQVISAFLDGLAHGWAR